MLCLFQCVIKSGTGPIFCPISVCNFLKIARCTKTEAILEQIMTWTNSTG